MLPTYYKGYKYPCIIDTWASYKLRRSRKKLGRPTLRSYILYDNSITDFPPPAEENRHIRLQFKPRLKGFVALLAEWRD